MFIAIFGSQTGLLMSRIYIDTNYGLPRYVKSLLGVLVTKLNTRQAICNHILWDLGISMLNFCFCMSSFIAVAVATLVEAET